MKLLRAIVRPDRDREVVRALEDAGVFALTKVPVTGRGRQGGAESGSLRYQELAKLMLLVVVDDDQVDAAVSAITRAAYTGYPGDGRVFVSDVARAVRIRTGETQASPREGGLAR
ncbi:MAG: P-II family nitrogen regulator [Polyangiaceae bacterium]|nr:P-II family nitrogen regulator [Polyangiaceae bacterium]